MPLPEHARDLIKLSLKGMGQEPQYDTPDGLGFVLVHDSGLTLHLLLRAAVTKGLFRRTSRLRIALYEDDEEGRRTTHFVELMDLPKGPSDMQFLLRFTPKVVAMIRAIAHLKDAGRLLEG